MPTWKRLLIAWFFIPVPGAAAGHRPCGMADILAQQVCAASASSRSFTIGAPTCLPSGHHPLTVSVNPDGRQPPPPPPAGASPGLRPRRGR